MNTSKTAPLLDIDTCSKSKATKDIFDLQEWYQNLQNCISLFQQIFVYKTFTVG